MATPIQNVENKLEFMDEIRGIIRDSINSSHDSKEEILEKIGANKRNGSKK